MSFTIEGLEKNGQMEFNTPSWRPFYHYSPVKNWMSDPNGLVYYDGEYHLFYQHDVYNKVFSNMSWGHAISRDLIHWNELNPAIEPSNDGLGVIYSGCTVVDFENRAGFGKETIFAYYTSTEPRQQQSMAFSQDKGRTFTKYCDNPIIPNLPEKGMNFDFRDPKIIWYEKDQIWIMCIAAKDHIQFWSSKNLIKWKKESEFGQGYGVHEHRDDGAWECPDLIQMEVKNKPGKLAWVLLVSMNKGGPNGDCGMQYFVGDFLKQDGSYVFQSMHKEVKWLDYGPDSYAGVSFTHLASRTVIVAWMSNWQYALDVPTGPWKGITSIPRELNLLETNEEFRITGNPIEEIRNLGATELLMAENVKCNQKYAFDDISSSRITLDVLDCYGEDVELTISNDINEAVHIGYDRDQACLYFDRRESGETKFSESFANCRHEIPLEHSLGDLYFEVMLDKMVIEVFFNNGLYTMSGIVFPNDVYKNIEIKTEAKIKSCHVYNMAKIMHLDME